MKINAVFIPRGNNINKIIFSSEKYRKYFWVTFLSTALISGIIIYSLEKDYINGKMTEAFSHYCTDLLNKSKPVIFAGLLTEVLPYIILILLFSTSAVGYIFTYCLSFIKFAGLGVCVSFIYSQYGIAGIKYCLLIFLPGKFFFILAALLLNEQCLQTSKEFRDKIRTPKYGNRNQIIKFSVAITMFFMSVGMELLLISAILRFTGITLLL